MKTEYLSAELGNGEKNSFQFATTNSERPRCSIVSEYAIGGG